jgi:hypothetical protein
MGKFSEEIIKQVWMKAFAQSNNNPEDFRKDYAGAWIKYSEYQQKTDYGWCIGYIVPPSKSGDKRIENLIPLHWKNKEQKGENYPEWESSCTSENTQNISQTKKWHV